MLFALFFIVAAVQLLKLGGPINHIHQHFLDRLTLGGRPRISLLPAAPAHIESTPVAFPGSLPVAIVDPVPSSSWEVVEVVNAPQPSSGHSVFPVESAPAALDLQPRDHRQSESSILDHVQPYAAALLAGVLVVILATVLVRVAATYARGHALIKAQLADFEKRELAQSAELAKLQAASIADAQLSDSSIRSLRNDKNVLAQRTREQESLIRQMTTQAEAAKNERLEHVLEFDGQAGLLRAARDEADRQSRVVEQLNATIADMQSREIALRAQLETQAEDARVREDELCHARDEELCDLQKAAFDSEQQATQLRAALADAEAGVERHRQDSAATISSLRLASDALQTELARVRGELTMAQDEAATFDRETVKLRGELYQALRSARISTAEQDATIGTLSAQLLDIQEQLVAVKQQAAEDVQELEALLISRDASAQLAVATLSGAVKDVVDDLELSADVQPTRAPVPELTVEELGPVEEADYDEDCSCTPIPAMVDRWLANYHATPSPQSAHSVASSPSCYSPGSSPIVGRMDVLFPVLANFDSSLHASTSTDSDLFGPSAPASFIRERNISAEPCGSPADAQMALVDDLRERIADLEWERADDAAYIEDLEDKLERIEAAMEETARVDNVVAASSLRLVGLEQEELATRVCSQKVEIEMLRGQLDDAEVGRSDLLQDFLQAMGMVKQAVEELQQMATEKAQMALEKKQLVEKLAEAAEEVAIARDPMAATKRESETVQSAASNSTSGLLALALSSFHPRLADIELPLNSSLASIACFLPIQDKFPAKTPLAAPDSVRLPSPPIVLVIEASVTSHPSSPSFDSGRPTKHRISPNSIVSPSSNSQLFLPPAAPKLLATRSPLRQLGHLTTTESTLSALFNVSLPSLPSPSFAASSGSVNLETLKAMERARWPDPSTYELIPGKPKLARASRSKPVLTCPRRVPSCIPRPVLGHKHSASDVARRVARPPEVPTWSEFAAGLPSDATSSPRKPFGFPSPEHKYDCSFSLSWLPVSPSKLVISIDRPALLSVTNLSLRQTRRHPMDL